MVNPLYLLSWSLLLIVDFDGDMPNFWRVFFFWLHVVKGFFFTMERILRSSTNVDFLGHPGLFMLLSSPVHSFFSWNVPNYWFDVPAFSPMYLFCFWSLTIVCFTCMDCSFDVGSQQQLPHANGALRINSRLVYATLWGPNVPKRIVKPGIFDIVGTDPRGGENI